MLPFFAAVTLTLDHDLETQMRSKIFWRRISKPKTKTDAAKNNTCFQHSLRAGKNSTYEWLIGLLCNLFMSLLNTAYWPALCYKVKVVSYVWCRHAIAAPLKSHGLTVGQIVVYLAASATPLPLSSDCFRLAGSFLYVRGKTNAYRMSSSFKPLVSIQYLRFFSRFLTLAARNLTIVRISLNCYQRFNAKLAMIAVVFRTHNIHSMEPAGTDDPVAWCVSLSRGCAEQKMAERIEVLFGVKTKGPKAHCIRWGPDSCMARGKGKGKGRNFCPL